MPFHATKFLTIFLKRDINCPYLLIKENIEVIRLSSNVEKFNSSKICIKTLMVESQNFLELVLV